MFRGETLIALAKCGIKRLDSKEEENFPNAMQIQDQQIDHAIDYGLF